MQIDVELRNSSLRVASLASDVDPREVLEPGADGWGSPYHDWRTG